MSPLLFAVAETEDVTSKFLTAGSFSTGSRIRTASVSPRSERRPPAYADRRPGDVPGPGGADRGRHLLVPTANRRVPGVL